MYSLENLPEKVSTGLRLTPRSYEAMKRLGLKLDDIVTRSVDEVAKMYNDQETDHALLEKRWQHYEAKRVNRITELKTLRMQVTDEEKKGFWSPQV